MLAAKKATGGPMYSLASVSRAASSSMPLATKPDSCRRVPIRARRVRTARRRGRMARTSYLPEPNGNGR